MSKTLNEKKKISFQKSNEIQIILMLNGQKLYIKVK